MPEKLYFAYGSNINLDQMAHRCPNAKVVSPVTLDGYRLVFRGGTPDNGVASIIPDANSKVEGLLWRITTNCERSLDIYEGYPHLYGKETVNVQDKDGNAYSVMVYVMTPAVQKLVAFPSMPYYTGIAQGYVQNGLPLEPLNAALQNCRREQDAQRKASQRKQPYSGRYTTPTKPKPDRSR